MRATDRRARLSCADCGSTLDDATADRNMLAAWTYCDDCLARLLAPLPDLARAQHTPAFRGLMRAQRIQNRELRRAQKRFRRLVIAHRRQRIAAQPRVGDVVVRTNGLYLRVAYVDWRGIWCQQHWRRERSLFELLFPDFTPQGWREEVRRARVTQEGSKQ